MSNEMAAASRRYFVVLDVGEYEGDQADVATWIEVAMTGRHPEHDIGAIVYEQLDDLIADRDEAAGPFDPTYTVGRQLV